MATKKKKTRPTFNYELRSVIFGWILLFLAALVAFGDKKSFVWELADSILSYLLGDSYKILFVPIVGIVAALIVLGRLSWNTVRFVGLLLYWISAVSLYEMVAPGRTHALLDFSALFIGWFGKIPAVLLLIGGLLVSLYLTLRISYRKVLSSVASRLPSSVEMVRWAVRDIRSEKAEMKNSSTKSSKAELKELEDKKTKIREELEELQKKWRKEASREDAEALVRERENAKQMSLSKAPRHIAIEKKTSEGKGFFATVFGGGELHPEKGSDESANKAKLSSPDFGKWETPPTKLLHEVRHTNNVSETEIRTKSLQIQDTLLHFGINVEMQWERVGPTVVQYRLDPADGVKLSKIENLKKDLTLALKAKSIRIQAPIPWVGLVGIEVPNEKRDMIGVREMLEHPNFTNHKSNLAVVLGKDINGDFVVWDLSKMPHLLVAGQTGSGKSVGMNAFILSLLFKNSPTELRMIMIDPKRVELGVYDGIPHLLTPVINEPDKALNALKWSVAEMIRRYDLLKIARVRNLGEFNEKASKKDRLPNIVIIIDELADFMMSGNKKEVESAIARIAQMARAVGMHLVVATQRPSVDVITGLIKANIPSRLAFTVASIADSRTILDRMGAEDLLGNGDMLYSPAGAMAAERIQGAYVSTEEVEAVVNHIKRTIDPAMLEDLYDASIVDGDRGNYEGSVGNGGLNHDEDPKIIEEAILFVRSQGKASTSMLQRHMRLGYSRAARVIDILEEMGVVGPADGSKPREVIG